MEIVLLYIFFSGLVYISWMYDPKDSWAIIVLNVFFGFTCGWFVTPILIGRAIAQVYKEE